MTMLVSTPTTIIDENLVSAATQWRRDLHMIPELRFDLHKTQQYLIDLLTSWGVSYDLGYATTGIVVTIEGKAAGKTIAFRCDMDALPMDDESGETWASTHTGVAHSCGHDGHMAVTLAAIYHLTKNNGFNGTVKILFQPNEETGQGAKAMMKDGLYNDHPYTELYGFHNMPRLDDGTVQLRYGATTGAGEIYTLEVIGKSGHSSVPHKCINPIIITSEIISQWNTITSGVHKDDMAIIATCTMKSGSTPNGIPEQAFASGTMRYFEAHVADYMRDEMHRIAQLVCNKYDASYDLNFDILCPATINTHQATDSVIECANDLFGADNVIVGVPASAGGEDMQFFVTDKVVESCWFMIGTKGSNLHTSCFDFDDTSIQRSASMLVNIAYNRLT